MCNRHGTSSLCSRPCELSVQALSRQLLQYQGREPETGLNSPVSVSGCIPCSDGPSLSASSCVGRSLASLLPSPSGALLGTASSSFSCFWMKDSIAASDMVPEAYKSTSVSTTVSPAQTAPPPPDLQLALSNGTTRAAHCPSAKAWRVGTRLQQPQLCARG